MTPQLVAAGKTENYVIEIAKTFGLDGRNYIAKVVAKSEDDSKILAETLHRFRTMDELTEWLQVAVDAWL
jgi:hypothetical protein